MGDAGRSSLRAAMDLVDRGLDLPEDEREALLLECPDPEVRAEARKLFEADARAGDFLSKPAIRGLPSALGAFATSPPLEGTRVGPFQLVSLLGKGGMGEVWLGRRDGADFEQKVAVKLLRHGSDATALARRFRLERQILARLAHPRIARLVDGGVTEQGQPWLAMELVDGLPITEHCSARELGVEQRLDLFLQVCDAVQFAHRNLVVHRDLKPRNILVSPGGEVKLLDFGIAKLLEDEQEGPTALTGTGERPMTPDYAAPEQVRGEAVTTATDVWALGVILHELLTGVRPHASDSKNRVDLERAILESAPSRPSSRVATSRALRSRLKGDLDAIVLKALRRKPEDRYTSAEALAADVRRHLDGRPVIARGDATSYLLRSFLRRHRVAVSFSALVLTALLVGLVGTLWQAHRAREQARKAERAQEFLVSMVQAFDPNEHGEPVSQRDILVRGEAHIDELDDQPEEQARLLRVFAQTWLNLGDRVRAREAAERALALERKALGPRSLEEATTLMVLGGALDDFDGAEQAHAEALSIARERERPDGLTAARAMTGLSGLARVHGRFAEAETLQRQALAIYVRLRGEEGNETLDAMGNLALVLGDEGRLDESADLNRHTALLFARVRGEDHPDTLIVRANLGRDLVELGRPEEADALLREVYDRQVRVHGEDSLILLGTLRSRARALDGMGRPAEAVLLFEQILRRVTEALGPESLEIARALVRESVALRHLGKLAEAEATARRALAIQSAKTGEDHSTARVRSVLGSALLAEGKIDEARDELSRALNVQERLLLPTHPDVVTTRAELARITAR